MPTTADTWLSGEGHRRACRHGRLQSPSGMTRCDWSEPLEERSLGRPKRGVAARRPLLPSMRATWAPRGRTPVLSHRFSWKRLSMAGALIYEPDGSDAELVFGMCPGAYNDCSLIEFLTELHHRLGARKMTLIWGRIPLISPRR